VRSAVAKARQPHQHNDHRNEKKNVRHGNSPCLEARFMPRRRPFVKRPSCRFSKSGGKPWQRTAVTVSSEDGAFGDEALAAGLIRAYEGRIAALEQLVDHSVRLARGRFSIAVADQISFGASRESIAPAAILAGVLTAP
jgi:hypothetical protein